MESKLISENKYKKKVRHFLIFSAALSLMAFFVIILCFFMYGAGQGILTPVAILLGILYIKRKTFYGPLVTGGQGHDSIIKDYIERGTGFGRPLLNLPDEGKRLLEQYAEQKKKVWRYTLPLLICLLIMFAIAFIGRGFYVHITLSEPSLVGSGGKAMYLTPDEWSIIYSILWPIVLIIILPLLAFTGTYYWNGFFFSLNIIRRWKKIFGDKYVNKSFETWLGRKVKVIIDRPFGSFHPEYPKTVYPINYGYIPDTISSADNKEIDAYVLGEARPLKTFEGKVIAVVWRGKDDEIKLVVTGGLDYPVEEIEKQINFVEKYYPHKIYK